MKYLDTYNSFLNEAWYSRKREEKKPSKYKPILSMEDYDKMTPEERAANKKALDEEGKRLDAEHEVNKKKRREEFKQADDAINATLKSFIGQKYSFQYSQYIWKSNSENYPEIDVADFTFKGINMEPRYDWNSLKLTDVFLTLNFTDRYDHNIEVYFDEECPTDKQIDLEYSKPWDLKRDKALRGDYGVKSSSINYDDPKSYPNRHGNVDMVPAEYRTNVLLQEIKGILQQANEEIKQKKF